MSPALSMEARVSRVLLVWAAILFFVLLWLALHTYFESCTNEVLSEERSPDGKHMVVLFERKCSNTVAWVTHVSVLPAGVQLPNSPGNALVSFERHGSLLEQRRQAPEVHARWVGPTELVFSYSKGAVVEYVATMVEGVSIVHNRTPQ